jgi:hypothetical protein
VKPTIKTKIVGVAEWDRTFRGYWDAVVRVAGSVHFVTLKYPISAAQAFAPNAQIEVEMRNGMACFVGFEGGDA